MNWNLFLKELKRNRRNALSWIIVIAAIIIFGMMFYQPLMESDLLVMAKNAMDNPFFGGVIKSFGVNPDQLTNILGFFISYNVMYTLLFGSIFAIILGSNIVLKEEAEKTADFLFSKPISRTEIMLSKLLTFFVYVVILNIVVVITGFSCLEVFKDEDYSREAFFILSLYEFHLMIFIGTVGLLISVFIKKGKSLSTPSIIIVVAAYFIDSLSKITQETQWVGYVSPFRFVNTDVFSADFGWDWWRIAYFIGLSFLFTVIALYKYKRKDILL